MGVLQGHEEGVVVEPGGLPCAEGVELAGHEALEPPDRVAQHAKAQAMKGAVVNAAGVIAPCELRVLVAAQEPLGGEVVEVDEVGVARVGREGLVGGVPVARGDDGQDLPDRHARTGEEVHERAGLRAHRPHAPGGGQRRHGHEHP